MTDGTAAAQADSTNTADFTQYLTLKKKGDSRVMNGVSFDSFLSMKQNGEFEEYSLLEDKQMQALFLQWNKRQSCLSIKNTLLWVFSKQS